MESSSPSPSLIINDLSPTPTEAVAADNPKRRRKRSSVAHKFNFKAPPPTNANKPRTPVIPAEVRSHIVRQCTMPSYTVMKKSEHESTLEANNDKDKKVCGSEYVHTVVTLYIIFSVS